MYQYIIKSQEQISAWVFYLFTSFVPRTVYSIFPRGPKVAYSIFVFSILSSSQSCEEG